MKEIEEKIKELKYKKLVINQKGFITSGICINEMIYNIKSDILNISDKSSQNYININLNQVFNFEVINNMIRLELDNDTIIELK